MWQGLNGLRKRLGIWSEIGGIYPSAAKADVRSVGFMRGLKPSPPSDVRFSAACKAEIDSICIVPGINPRPTARISSSGACKAWLLFERLAVAFDCDQSGLLMSCSDKRRGSSWVSCRAPQMEGWSEFLEYIQQVSPASRDSKSAS
jgi:hypothetical protein